jgi:glycosyltransferase involved in cell wall biosynthesis
LANSEGLYRRIRQKYKVHCLKVAGGVNTGLFRPQPRTKSTQEFRILCYGRIHKRRKGIRYVIRAVESLAKSFPQIKLVFFDSIVGKERVDPRTLVRTSVPFEFHLDCPQEELAWIFSQSDLYVSAEWRAGWANTSAEAMACGVPVVCTSSGTQDFAFHNRTALVVPLPFPVFLRRQIRKIISNNDLRLRLGRAGLKTIRKFSWPVLADRLEQVFRESVKLK